MLGRSPEEATEIHSSFVGWRIPWIEEPGGLQSMGLQRVKHDWVTKHSWYIMGGRYGCWGESPPLFWSHVGNLFVAFVPSILCLILYVSDQIYPKLFYSKALIICYNMVAQWLRTRLPLKEMHETRIWFLGQEDPLEKDVNSLQYSCLENPMDREAWWATVHGVTNRRTQLSNWIYNMQGIVLASIENTNMILFFKKRKKKKKISDDDSVHSKDTNCYSVFRK